MPTRVKICGITRIEDAQTAVKHGAHAIGSVFYEKSPRNVAVALAKQIKAALPPFVANVGLFVNPSEEQINNVLKEIRLDLIQFHGEESPKFCRKFNVPYLKAIRVTRETDLMQYAREYYDAKALLLDAYVEGRHGGTGTVFDWNLIPTGLPLPLILSGGLTPQNVGEAIRSVKPWAVDVSSGVEASAGIKDAEKIASFFEGVRHADI